MVGSLFLILITGVMNTAIEVLVDRISEKSHPLFKKAKDIGSAIVLLAFINWGFIWTLIVLKKVIY